MKALTVFIFTALVSFSANANFYDIEAVTQSPKAGWNCSANGVNLSVFSNADTDTNPLGNIYTLNLDFLKTPVVFIETSRNIVNANTKSEAIVLSAQYLDNSFSLEVTAIGSIEGLTTYKSKGKLSVIQSASSREFKDLSCTLVNH